MNREAQVREGSKRTSRKIISFPDHAYLFRDLQSSDLRLEDPEQQMIFILKHALWSSLFSLGFSKRRFLVSGL